VKTYAEVLGENPDLPTSADVHLAFIEEITGSLWFDASLMSSTIFDVETGTIDQEGYDLFAPTLVEAGEDLSDLVNENPPSFYCD
jgi:hypothetical protein